VKSLRLVLTLVIAVALCGCSAGEQAALDDYLERLGRALQVEPPESDGEALQAVLVDLPGRRQLSVNEPQLSINLLDFLSLSSCELGRVLGANNSSLGKLAAPSQRLHLQRDLMLSAPECIDVLGEDDPELAEKLRRLLQQKYDARMTYWWNAWLSSEEWQAFLSRSEGLIPMAESSAEDQTTLLAATQALAYVVQQGQQWQSGEWKYESAVMESHQQQMLATAAIGRWRLTNRALMDVSIKGARLLEQRLGDRPLCPAGRRTPQAEILQNVFHKYYAGVLQPYLSKTDRFSAELIGYLSVISSLAPTGVVDEWQVDVINVLEEERAAMLNAHRRHVTKWQDILAQCAMMPGSQ
tara:strand:- start:6444 stop:7505 length:1062 start_codon:yes stop_codon:yes gene_type:complete